MEVTKVTESESEVGALSVLTWGHWLPELGHGVVTTEVENEVAL